MQASPSWQIYMDSIAALLAAAALWYVCSHRGAQDDWSPTLQLAKQAAPFTLEATLFRAGNLVEIIQAVRRPNCFAGCTEFRRDRVERSLAGHKQFQLAIVATPLYVPPRYVIMSRVHYANSSPFPKLHPATRVRFDVRALFLDRPGCPELSFG